MNKMNERIRELAEQAGADDFRLPHSWNYALVGIESIEKFAELLVRECAEIANNKMKDLVDSIICEEKIDTEVFVGNKIKEHFGVE